MLTGQSLLGILSLSLSLSLSLCPTPAHTIFVALKNQNQNQNQNQNKWESEDYTGHLQPWCWGNRASDLGTGPW